MPEPPLEYIVLKYAQKLHISYQDALTTPAHILFRNLDMLRLEAEYATPKGK